MPDGGNYGGNSLGRIAHTHLNKPFPRCFVTPTSSAIILDVDVADRPQGNRLQIPPSGFDPEEELLDLTIPFSPP